MYRRYGGFEELGVGLSVRRLKMVDCARSVNS